ncbi:MAG: helix-turn-helix domain-containing protein [Kiloniellales bacterium]
MSQKLKASVHTGAARGSDRNLPKGAQPPVASEGELYPNGHTNPWHSHDRACLIYPAEGVVTVETEKGHWVVPPQRAVWVPGGVRHQTCMSGQVALRSLIVDQASIPDLPESLCVLGITPFLRELILHTCAEPMGPTLDGPDGRIIAVILDQLRSLPVPAFPLPIPQDRRLQRLVEALLQNPADSRSLEDWGRTVGASSRTLARLFRAETAMTFRAWRQHLRVLEALRRLAQGEAVTTVALDVGYESPSAFVQMFKKCLGRTPGRYFS